MCTQSQEALDTPHTRKPNKDNNHDALVHLTLAANRTPETEPDEEAEAAAAAETETAGKKNARTNQQ